MVRVCVGVGVVVCARALHSIHIMTGDIDVFCCRRCCELYHNSEDCSRKENISREYLCGIHPSCRCGGEVHMKALPFPAPLLQAWPMTKNTILLFLLSRWPHPESWTFYGWNVTLGSFTFLHIFPPPIEATGLTHSTTEHSASPFLFWGLIPFLQSTFPTLLLLLQRGAIISFVNRTECLCFPHPPPRLPFSISGNDTFIWLVIWIRQ